MPGSISRFALASPQCFAISSEHLRTGVLILLLIASLARSGSRADALKLRDEMRRESARRYIANYFFAVASIALGEKDEAFAALEKDFADRAPCSSWFAVDPLLDDLHDDPRFADLARRVATAKLD